MVVKYKSSNIIMAIAKFTVYIYIVTSFMCIKNLIQGCLGG